MPAELREHLRYPEDLFRVQTELYSKYQVDPADFFQRTGAWSVAQAPSVDRQDTSRVVSQTVDPTDVQTEFATETSVERFVPYYTVFRNGITGEEEFVILRPFVKFSTDDSRTELQAYMTASSDPDTYGQLVTYVVDQDPLPPGPLRVADQAESEQDISPELSLQANEETGTKVKFGDLQLLPVADGLVYIRPVYVISGDVTEYRFVIVSHDNAAVLATGLDDALARLFPGFDGEIGDRVADVEDEPDTPDDGRPRSTQHGHRRSGGARRRGRAVVRRGPAVAARRRSRWLPGEARRGRPVDRPAQRRTGQLTVSGASGNRRDGRGPGGTRSDSGPVRWPA